MISTGYVQEEDGASIGPPPSPAQGPVYLHNFQALGIRNLYPRLRKSAPGSGTGLPGWISAGFQSGKLQNRPSGRPKAGRRAVFEAFQIRIRPKSGLEAPNRRLIATARPPIIGPKSGSGTRGLVRGR